MKNSNFNLLNSKIALAALLVASAFAALPAYAAYAVPQQFECPRKGYYNIVTEPADVPANYAGAVIQFRLPPNVCVRRLNDFSPGVTENFTKFDFIKINVSALEPFPGVVYNSALYEPVIGHYVLGRNISPGDFRGTHPVLMRKTAAAAIRLENGFYYIDKQSKIDGETKSICPNNYSTVGSSAICYSKTNGLKLNRFNKVELMVLNEHFDAEDFPPQSGSDEDGKPRSSNEKCPLGYTMNTTLGSHGGICMPVRMVLQHTHNIMSDPNPLTQQWTSTLLDFGVSLPDPGDCGPLQASQKAFISNQENYTTRCMPELTAITCKMDEASRAKFTKTTYPGDWAVTLLDTRSTDTAAELPTRLSLNMMKMTRSEIRVSQLNKMLALIPDDDWFVAPSPVTNSGSVPIWVMHTGLSCATLWEDKIKRGGGYSLEPLPSGW